MEQAAKKEHKSLTDFLRWRFKDIIVPVAAFLNRIGLKPNMVTLIGLLGHVLAAVLVGMGHITWGGIVLLVFAPVDFLDGTMARLRGEPTRFGAFVDSVTDRYSELFIFGGLLYYFATQERWLLCLLAYAAITGSLLVSYIRARSEALEYPTKVGLLTRVERYLILLPSLVFNIPVVGLWLIAIFSHFTAIQRILDVRYQAHDEINRSK